MRLFGFQEKNNKQKIYFLGIPIFKIKKINEKKEYYLFGIKIFENKDYFSILENKIDDLKYNLPIQIQVPYVHNYLKKYRNCNLGKSLAIISCGPTSNYYSPINNAKHLSINKAVLFEKIKFDYCFLTDKYTTTDTNEIVDNYKIENCEKFYCLIPERRFKQIKGLPNAAQIPMMNYLNSDANLLLLEDIVAHKWARELSFEPLGDFEGTIYSALQFALYTHPKKIYLVGCDETLGGGYFFDKPQFNVKINEYARNIYEKFKQFSDYEYPDVEIISVNPIGLRGLFKDVYTKEFLENVPEIKKQLGSDVQILDNNEVGNV